jgi:ATP phosphoribosyltransferase
VTLNPSLSRVFSLTTISLSSQWAKKWKESTFITCQLSGFPVQKKNSPWRACCFCQLVNVDSLNELAYSASSSPLSKKSTWTRLSLLQTITGLSMRTSTESINTLSQLCRGFSNVPSSCCTFVQSRVAVLRLHALLVLLTELWISLVSIPLLVKALLLTTVESGETMKATGLKPIDTVVSSTAVLIKSKNPTNLDVVELVAARIRGVRSKRIPPPVPSVAKDPAKTASTDPSKRAVRSKPEWKVASNLTTKSSAKPCSKIYGGRRWGISREAALETSRSFVA